MVGELMKKPWLFSFLVGTGAMVVCLIQISIVVPLLGEPYQASMFINGVIGCYGIGSPVAYYLTRQAERLRLANEELERMQNALSKAHDAMAQKVRIDHMTGFLNREHFFEAFNAIREMSAKDSENTLLIIDADHFKRINDQFGHLTGDTALELITKAIRKAVRVQDTVGRIGGEEFAVLLPATTSAEAKVVAERIRRTVEAIEFIPQGQNDAVPLTVSIGGSRSASHAELSAVMGAADRNLYAAKDAGRNRVIIESQLAVAA